MLTSLPTSTLSSSSILSDFFLSPRIYPVFWRDGAIYIGSLASEKTQELVHLYDQPTQVSSSGDITYLYNDSETAKISPDGRTLVYMNMEDGFLYSYNLITKEKKKISQPDSGSSQRTWQGSWSLDGKYLLYAMDIVELRDDEVFGQEFPSIFITDITQDIFSQVTTWNTAEISPVWSPDSQWIAFTSDNAKVNSGALGSFVGSSDIFVMSTKCVVKIENCKNSFFKQLTNTGINGDVYAPDWQPNSSNIGFIYVNGQSGDRDIYLVDLNGSITNLTNTPNDFEEAFRWSPDGEKLVFKRFTPGTGTDLFVLNILDKTIVNITNSPNIIEGIPSWSPNGKEIAFDQNADDTKSGITIFSVDNNKLHLLTNSNSGSFLFWLTIFPEITKDVTLTVSPSGKNLNVRSEPSGDSQILAKLQSGDIIIVLGQPIESNGYTWWKIRHNEVEGWVVQIYDWYLPITVFP